MTIPDYSAHVKDPSEGAVRELKEIVREFFRLNKEVKDRQLELNMSQTKRDYLAEDKIPELMVKLNREDFTVDGLTIKLKQEIYADISEANKKKVFGWMDENGHGGMIKSEIIVAFNREQWDQAKELRDNLKHEGYAGVKQKATVHKMTLKKWVRERLEAGEEVPDGVWVDRKITAKIK